MTTDIRVGDRVVMTGEARTFQEKRSYWAVEMPDGSLGVAFNPQSIRTALFVTKARTLQAIRRSRLTDLRPVKVSVTYEVLS